LPFQPLPVQLQPRTNLAVALAEIRDIEVVVAVPHNTYKIPSMPPPFEYSQG